MWRRSQDRLGVAVVSNGLSAPHREYLASGGQGFLLGDGTLPYGREDILETYYTARVAHPADGHDACLTGSLAPIAIVVVPVLPPLPIPVAPAIAVPAVIVIVVPARRVPVPFDVAAANPIRLDPVRFRERRTCPVAVMPKPAPVAGIPIAFDPVILGARQRRHAIDPRRRGRRAEREAERNLRVHGGRWTQQQTTEHGEILRRCLILIVIMANGTPRNSAVRKPPSDHANPDGAESRGALRPSDQLYFFARRSRCASRRS